MIVENKELRILFQKGEEGDWDPFFGKVESIVDYTMSTKFPNLKFYHYDPESVKQECLLQVWKLINKNQLKKDSNMFSYIMGAVSFMLRDCIRKENRRKSKAKVVNVDNQILSILKGQRF